MALGTRWASTPRAAREMAQVLTAGTQPIPTLDVAPSPVVAVRREPIYAAIRRVTSNGATFDAPVAQLPAPAQDQAYRIERMFITNPGPTNAVLVYAGDVTDENLADSAQAPADGVPLVTDDSNGIYIAETKLLSIVWAGAASADGCYATIQYRVEAV